MSKVEAVHHEIPIDGKEAMVHEEDAHGPGVQTKVFKGSEALAEVLAKEPPQPRSKRMLQFYGMVFLSFLCSTMNGYDGSLMSALLVMTPFQQEFGASVVGVRAGYITAMYQIGGVVALPFAGPCSDQWGRRFGMFIGCALVILGTILQGTSSLSHSLPCFMGGRFLLGFGVNIAATAAPTYVVEIAHPAYRGTLTGLYNCCYFVGSIIAAGSTRGSVGLTSNQSWLIPTWLQMVCSCCVVIGVFFLPESPRWLFTHGREEEARRLIGKYHGNDNLDSLYVTFQISEFTQSLEANGADRRWWDYRALFRTRKSAYRVMCGALLLAFSQLSGASIGSYLGGFYGSAGVSNPSTILDLNLGSSLMMACFSVTGASFADRWGRRPLIFFYIIGNIVCWTAIIAGTATYSENGSVAGGIVGIVFYWFTNIVGSFAMTPLQALYPVECLSYEQRAKGMAFVQLVSSVALLVGQFGTPVALARIGWKVYIVFTCWCFIELLIAYLYLVEPKGRTLEELDEIFASPNPRKASTMKKKIVLDADANIVEVKQL